MDLYWGDVLLQRGVECTVLSVDRQGDNALGFVGIDEDLSATEGYGSLVCSDFDNDGQTPSSGDLFSYYFPHYRHYPHRRVYAPNGGETLDWGEFSAIRWRHGAGDSSRVSVFLTRDSRPGQDVLLGSNLN
jgi:hypothetical protein